VLTVEDWAEIRRLYRAEGILVKAIARAMGSRGTRCGRLWRATGRRSTSGLLRGLRSAYLVPDPASRTAEAISLHEQSLAGRERVLGPGHPAP